MVPVQMIPVHMVPVMGYPQKTSGKKGKKSSKKSGKDGKKGKGQKSAEVPVAYDEDYGYGITKGIRVDESGYESRYDQYGYEKYGHDPSKFDPDSQYDWDEVEEFWEDRFLN